MNHTKKKKNIISFYNNNNQNAQHIEMFVLFIFKCFAVHYRCVKVVHFYLSLWIFFFFLLLCLAFQNPERRNIIPKMQWIRFIFKDYRFPCRTLQKPTSYEDIKMKFMTYSISIRLSRVSGPYGGSCFTIFFFSHSLVKSIRFFFFSIRQKRLLSLNLCFFRFDRIQLNFFLSQNAVSIFYMN